MLYFKSLKALWGVALCYCSINFSDFCFTREKNL
nr:MAG TPA: hypothetical protein [Caudoviricetes sp.]